MNPLWAGVLRGVWWGILYFALVNAVWDVAWFAAVAIERVCK